MLDLTQFVKDSSGEDLEQYMEEEKEMQKMPLGKALAGVVLHAPCPEEKCGLEYKLARYDLFLKLRDADSVELSDKEKEILIELTNLHYDVFFTGYIVGLIK